MAADGSIIIDTRIDTSEFTKANKSMKSQAMSLAATYRKQGYSQSEAMKKAWSEIERNSSKGSKKVKKHISDIGTTSNATASNVYSNLSGLFTKLGTIIASAFAVTQLVQFGKEAINLGSDLQEVQNVVDVTFTTMNEKVNEFAKTAMTTAGLSETMAKKYVGLYGAMSKSFGFDESEAYEMSTALTQLAGDVASFYNITQDEAYTKLKSVFSGETETLKDLGVVMTQNALDSYAMAKGYGKTTKAMSEQEKVALRYAFVIDQLSGASGDFLRTSDSWANQTRVLALQFDSLKATIGQGLINLLTPAVKLFNTLIGKLQVLADAFKSFTEMLTGNKATESSTAGLEEITDATNDVTEATEEAEKAQKSYLSGLDEIKHFSDSSDSDTSASRGLTANPTQGSVDNGELATSETILDNLLDKVKELGSIVRDGFVDGFSESEGSVKRIRTGLKTIAQEIKGIFKDVSVSDFTESYLYMLGSLAGSVASIGASIAEHYVIGFQKFLSGNSDKIKQWLTNMFDIGSAINNSLATLFQDIAEVFTVFAGENATDLRASIYNVFAEAFMGVTELAGIIVADIVERIATGFSEHKEELKQAFDDTFGYLASIFEYLGEQVIPDTTKVFKKLWSDVLSPFIDYIEVKVKPLFDILAYVLNSFWQNVIVPLASAVGDVLKEAWKSLIEIIEKTVIPKWSETIELLTKFWKNVASPLADWLLKVFGPVIDSAFSKIGDKITTCKELLLSFISFIKNILLGKWSDAWSDFKDIVSNIFQQLVDKLKSPINKLIDFLNEIVSAAAWMANQIATILNGISFDIPDNIPVIGGMALDFDFPTWTPGKIPYLAKGAVIPPNAPFTAVLGDQRHGNNLEAPEDLIRKIVREESGGGGTLKFVGQINRRTLFEEFIDEAKLRQMQTGNNPFQLT